jgi:hypothetical protein
MFVTNVRITYSGNAGRRFQNLYDVKLFIIVLMEENIWISLVTRFLIFVVRSDSSRNNNHYAINPSLSSG